MVCQVEGVGREWGALFVIELSSQASGREPLFVTTETKQISSQEMWRKRCEPQFVTAETNGNSWPADVEEMWVPPFVTVVTHGAPIY